MARATRAVNVPASALAKPPLYPVPLCLGVSLPCRWRFWLGKTQAHRYHTAAAHLVRQQSNRAEFDDIASPCLAAQLFAEIIRERYLDMVGGYLQSVYLRERSKCRGSRHKEIAEQPWIGRSGRRQVDEKTVERLRFFRRRQEIDVVALAHRMRFHRSEDFLIADDKCRPRPGRDKTATKIWTVCAHRVSDNLARELTW